MLLTDKGGGDFESPDAGSYGAICRQLIDLGTQETEYQGKKGSAHQLFLGWELDELMTDGRPFVMGRFYTASLSEKATLRQHLAAWRGRDFTPDELGGFDPANLLGKPCMLSIIINDKGKTRIGGVSKLPKGMTLAPLVNPTVYFSLEFGKYDQNVFDTLPEGLKKIIMQSPEWQARNAEAHSVVPAPSSTDDAFDNFEDDIPFN
jgi:hypothetical protein